MNKKKTIILHTCCGICAGYVVEILKKEFAKITLYFYNPNIHPKEEYEKRKEAARKITKAHQSSRKTSLASGGIDFLKGEYESEKWFHKIKGLEKEPEGGKRCPLCYQMRLEKTARLARKKGYDAFATTLTISPYKNTRIINQIGKALSKKYGIQFLENDFKKKDGFKKTIEIAKRYNLYRQKYCGCVFSKIKYCGTKERIREVVSSIPKGKILTYKKVAHLAGVNNPRTVGWALKGNQNPKIPCHRVVRAKGFLAKDYSLGGWEEQKRRLLKEGIIFLKENQVDFQKHLWLK